MSINKITRMLLSMAVAVMLIGFTGMAQDKKDEMKKEAKPATTEMKEAKKEHKKMSKSKAVMEKKGTKEMKKEEMKKEEMKKDEKKPQ
jgi:hypothetical protein